MKTQKIITYLTLITILMIGTSVFFSSCSKYEEGPSFSLLSVTKRITGTWELKETVINDQVVDINDMLEMFGEVDMDSMAGFEIDPSQISVNSVKITFEKEGTGNFAFSISYMSFPLTQSEDMIWSFDDDKKNVSLTIMGDVQTFEIIRLTNKELWLKRIETIDGVETTTIMKAEKEED